MRLYRDAVEDVAPAAMLARLHHEAGAVAPARGLDHDGITSLLIDAGVLEAGLADRHCRDIDDVDPWLGRLRAMTLAAGRLFRASVLGLDTREAARGLGAAIDAVRGGPLPAELTVKVPEGYAWYALYPETYLAAAAEAAARLPPGEVVCLGLRGIGTSLSGVVAAAFAAAGHAVTSYTLRPRGHPFDRRPVLAERLAQLLREQRAAHFLVIDEGPGLSGSSLTGTAALLGELGIDDDRILLACAHEPDPDGFVNVTAGQRWRRYRRLHRPLEAAAPPALKEILAGEDVAGGRWRSLLVADGGGWPAVRPELERRKYLASGSDGRRALHKFVGLGRYGAAAAARATRLAEQGFGPAVRAFRAGFITQPWLGGRNARAGAAEPALLAQAARYMAVLRRDYALGRAVAPEPLLDMVRTNVGEGLGPGREAAIAALARQLRAAGPIEAVRVDGRMLPQDWLLTEAGWKKTDAVDHGDDHFYPGPTDIAWDLAAIVEELGCSPAQTAMLVDALGDRHLDLRLPFHRVAWQAFRLGWAEMGRRAAAPDERLRLAAVAATARRRLTELLGGGGEAIASARLAGSHDGLAPDAGPSD